MRHFLINVRKVRTFSISEMLACRRFKPGVAYGKHVIFFLKLIIVSFFPLVILKLMKPAIFSFTDLCYHLKALRA